MIKGISLFLNYLVFCVEKEELDSLIFQLPLKGMYERLALSMQIVTAKWTDLNRFIQNLRSQIYMGSEMPGDQW